MLFKEVFRLLFLQYLLNYEFKNYGIKVVYPSTRVSATGASSLGFAYFFLEVSYLFMHFPCLSQMW